MLAEQRTYASQRTAKKESKKSLKSEREISTSISGDVRKDLKTDDAYPTASVAKAQQHSSVDVLDGCANEDGLHVSANEPAAVVVPDLVEKAISAEKKKGSSDAPNYSSNEFTGLPIRTPLVDLMGTKDMEMVSDHAQSRGRSAQAPSHVAPAGSIVQEKNVHVEGDVLPNTQSSKRENSAPTQSEKMLAMLSNLNPNAMEKLVKFLSEEQEDPKPDTSTELAHTAGERNNVPPIQVSKGKRKIKKRSRAIARNLKSSK
ncbi:hypothetical protein FGB62_209g03 [Gracilaria domingensis]|nr:hypothetical protein FGB62_209g03 [Gracilaria domingensis]